MRSKSFHEWIRIRTASLEEAGPQRRGGEQRCCISLQHSPALTCCSALSVCMLASRLKVDVREIVFSIIIFWPEKKKHPQRGRMSRRRKKKEQENHQQDQETGLTALRSMETELPVPVQETHRTANCNLTLHSRTAAHQLRLNMRNIRNDENKAHAEEQKPDCGQNRSLSPIHQQKTTSRPFWAASLLLSQAPSECFRSQRVGIPSQLRQEDPQSRSTNARLRPENKYMRKEIT